MREDGAVEKPCDNLQPSAAGQQLPATPPSTLATQVQHTEPAEGGSRTEHGEATDDWHSVVPQVLWVTLFLNRQCCYIYLSLII